MLDRADAIFKLTLAFAALCAGVGVGYYYAIFVPMQAAEVADRVQRAEEEKRNQEREEARRKSERADAAQSKYDACVSGAFTNYITRWNSTCSDLHDEAQERLSRCVANGGSPQYCSSWIVVPPAINCSLNNQLMNSYDSTHQEEKNQCLEEFKAAKLG